MLFPVLTVLMLFIVWFTWRLHASERRARKASKTFWEEEQKANQTRRQSLDSVTFIEIPLEQLPFLNEAEEPIASYQKQIQSLSGQKIASFQGLTNTQLKTAYGAANLELLTQYEQNYLLMIQILYQWGKALYDQGLTQEAIQVLEYGLSCKTDISKHYTLLAEIYKQENDFNKIFSLISTAEKLNSLMKPAILKSLNEIAESCHAPE